MSDIDRQVLIQADVSISLRADYHMGKGGRKGPKPETGSNYMQVRETEQGKHTCKCHDLRLHVSRTWESRFL